MSGGFLFLGLFAVFLGLLCCCRMDGRRIYVEFNPLRWFRRDAH